MTTAEKWALGAVSAATAVAVLWAVWGSGEAEGAPARRRTRGRAWRENGRLLTRPVVRFAYGQNEPTAQSMPALEAVARWMNENQSVSVDVVGHTDNVGSESFNLRLGQARAQAVIVELTRLGIPSSRLSALTGGEGIPIASNDTEEGRAANRRADFLIAT